MEIAAALATTFAATAAPTAAAAGGVAGTAAASSTALTILQGATSVFGALSAIGAGSAAADQANAQAFQAENEVVAEEARGLDRSTRLKRSLARVVGDNTVNFAAAGIDISSGIAAEDRQEQTRRAVSELNIDRADTERQQAALRARGAGLRGQARTRRLAGFIKGGTQLAQFGVGALQRG